MVHKLFDFKKDSKDTRIVNPHLQPDLHDSYYYCKACEVTFLMSDCYIEHLGEKHGISVPPPKKKLGKSPIKPDLDNSEYYCTVCEKRYQSHISDGI
jgi:uncharacterized C2H2 Zn-finger protein